MGLLDGILGKKGQSSSGRESSVSADRVQEEYSRLSQSGQTVPGNILVRMGDIHRDLGDRERAVGFYQEAAEQFVREETWSLAEATARRVRQMLGRPTSRMLLCHLEIALGRRLPAAAKTAIEDLGKMIRPSDSAEIERMVEVVDLYALRDVSVEVALSEFLCTVGRPERAVERLQVALFAARQKGDQQVIRDVEERLGQLDPIGGSVRPAVEKSARASKPRVGRADPPAPGLPSAPPAEPARPAAASPAKPKAGAGEAVRVVANDGRADGRDDDAAVRELIRQLRAGLDEHIPADDAEQHFDLGYAFLEMRLFEEAVREFTMAFRSEDFRLRAAQGLAQALIEGGQAVQADEILTSVRPQIGGGDSSHGLIYWHARAHEAVGRSDEALALYRRISRSAPDFQDVSTRITTLEAAG